MAGADDRKWEFTKLLDGIRGAEGPVFDRQGNFYMVGPLIQRNNKFAGQIFKVNLDTLKATVLCEPNVKGDGGAPAGLQCDKEGNLLVADMRLGILKVSPSGHCQQIAGVDSEGRTLQGCNDCIFDYHGNLWVTAPAGEIAPSEYRHSMEDPFGSVYCVTREGEVIRADTGIRFPNGIAVRHDDRGQPQQLIVAETATKLLLTYDIKGPGLLTNRKEWAKLPGDLEGGADGMDLDDQGNLLVAHWGSGHIEVFPLRAAPRRKGSPALSTNPATCTSSPGPQRST